MNPAPSPEPGPTADDILEIGRLVLELVHAGYASGETARATSSSAHGHGTDGSRVSRPAIRASIALYQRGGMTMRQLAAASGMSNGWASRVVEELVRAGFAERTTDPLDRRVTHVRLSPAAVDVVENAYRWRGEAIERAMSGLDAAARAAVRTFLARAIEELSTPDERHGPPAPGSGRSG